MLYIQNNKKKKKKKKKTFQMEVIHWFHYLQNTYFKKEMQLSKKHFVIVERSPFTGYEIFTKNLFELGLLCDWEYSLLTRYYSMVFWEPKYFLYLRCKPDDAISRIKKRDRNAENKVDSNLIQQLHERHELLFVSRYGVDVDKFQIDENCIIPQHDKTLKNPSVIYVNAENEESIVLLEALKKN